jgi:hypothetical protein
MYQINKSILSKVDLEKEFSLKVSHFLEVLEGDHGLQTRTRVFRSPTTYPEKGGYHHYYDRKGFIPSSLPGWRTNGNLNEYICA